MSETPSERGFTVEQPSFSGSLGELLTELRSGRLLPAEVDLLALVRSWLAYFSLHWQDDPEVASEALPLVSSVLELKLRLLLPRPPRTDPDGDEDTEVIDAVAGLVNLENAIRYLSDRREDRRLLLPARASVPPLARPERPLGLKPGRLAELAGRIRNTGYFEIMRNGFGFREARARLLALLGRKPFLRFSEVREGEEWSRVTVMFAVLLELVRQGRVLMDQPVRGGDLHVKTVAGSSSRPPRRPD